MKAQSIHIKPLMKPLNKPWVEIAWVKIGYVKSGLNGEISPNLVTLLASDKRFSLICCSVRDEERKVHNIDARGVDCALEDVPGVYVNIYNYIDFITQRY